jgi:hypothetical protein
VERALATALEDAGVDAHRDAAFITHVCERPLLSEFRPCLWAADTSSIPPLDELVAPGLCWIIADLRLAGRGVFVDVVPSADSVNELLSRYGLDPGARLISGAVGELTPGRGHILLQGDTLLAKTADSPPLEGLLSLQSDILPSLKESEFCWRVRPRPLFWPTVTTHLHLVVDRAYRWVTDLRDTPQQPLQIMERAGDPLRCPRLLPPSRVRARRIRPGRPAILHQRPSGQFCRQSEAHGSGRCL